MSRPRLGAVLAGAITSLLLAAGPAPAAEPGITPLGFTHGGRPVDTHAGEVEALKNAPAGGKWVRLFFDWNQTEPADDSYNAATVGGLDSRLRSLEAQGIHVVITVQSPPAWAPSINTDAGAAEYAEFMAYLADRYKGQVEAWELWNEPNDERFWPDGPKPARYAAMLQRAHPAIKAADPHVAVVVGGLVGNDFEFVEALYANGAGEAFDGVAVHTDTACRIAGPDEYYREPDGRVGRYAFTGYREVHAVMARHGHGHRGIWMTEIGWTAADDLTCDEGVNAGKREKGVTPARQAQFLKQAYGCIAADPYVKMASWFTLQDHVPDSRFGLYDHDGVKRPAFAAMQEVGDGTGAGVDHDCGGKVDADAPAVTIIAPSRYFHRFTTTGTATDPTTPVRKVELWADGKRVISQRGATFSYDWFGSSRLGYGRHHIQLRAYDEAGNVGIAESVVTRGHPRRSARTVEAAVRLKVRRAGRRLRMSATVRPPADDSFAEQPRGRLELRMERRAGGRWQRSRVRKGIGDGGVHYTSTPRRPGRWRVYAVLDADAPYKRTRTRAFTFRLR